MVGHVDHGKTTLTQALSGVWTDTHSEERKRGISIKLGYADTAFYKTVDGRFYAKGKHPEDRDDSDGELLRVVSFVDAPGHETLMAVMISGASIMDGAMLLIAATEKCPQPQTREHLAALQIAGIENIVVVQNKIDIVTRERAVESYGEIKEFLSGTIAEGAPIIPVSAHHDVNLDILIQAIEDVIPTPDRPSDETGLMYVARSFDTNRPGSRPEKAPRQDKKGTCGRKGRTETHCESFCMSDETKRMTCTIPAPKRRESDGRPRARRPRRSFARPWYSLPAYDCC